MDHARNPHPARVIICAYGHPAYTTYLTAVQAAPSRRQLAPFAALSATYFAHIGFFNPYLPLWLKHLGLPIVVIVTGR